MDVPVGGLLTRLPLVLAFVVATAGCGGSEGRRLALDVKEFGYSQPQLTLKRGERVTIELRNVGTVEHEFMAGNLGHGGMGYMQDLFAGVKHDVSPTESLHGNRHGMPQGGAWVKPGKSTTITFTVPDRPGTYEFGCFVVGHYEAGMKGSLTIE
jgi:uncharacterized cupredoxin-like copper-binding protein